MTCCTSCCSARPCVGCSSSRPGLAAVALPALAANVLAAREHTTDPHVTTSLRSSRFSSLRRRSVSARLLAALRAPRSRSRGRRSRVAANVAIGPWPGSVLGASDWDGRGTIDTSPEHVHALESAIALVPSARFGQPRRTVSGHISLHADTSFSAPLRRLGGLGRSGYVGPVDTRQVRRSAPTPWVWLRSGKGSKRARAGNRSTTSMGGPRLRAGRRNERRRSLFSTTARLVARAGSRQKSAPWEDRASGPR